MERLALFHSGEIMVQYPQYGNAVHLEVVLYFLIPKVFKRCNPAKSSGDDQGVDGWIALEEGKVGAQKVDLFAINLGKRIEHTVALLVNHMDRITFVLQFQGNGQADAVASSDDQCLFHDRLIQC